MVVARTEAVMMLVVLFTTTQPGEGEAGSAPFARPYHREDSERENDKQQGDTPVLRDYGARVGPGENIAVTRRWLLKEIFTEVAVLIRYSPRDTRGGTNGRR